MKRKKDQLGKDLASCRCGMNIVVVLPKTRMSNLPFFRKNPVLCLIGLNRLKCKLSWFIIHNTGVNLYLCVVVLFLIPHSFTLYEYFPASETFDFKSEFIQTLESFLPVKFGGTTEHQHIATGLMVDRYELLPCLCTSVN